MAITFYMVSNMSQGDGNAGYSQVIEVNQRRFNRKLLANKWEWQVKNFECSVSSTFCCFGNRLRSNIC